MQGPVVGLGLVRLRSGRGKTVRRRVGAAQ